MKAESVNIAQIQNKDAYKYFQQSKLDLMLMHGSALDFDKENIYHYYVHCVFTTKEYADAGYGMLEELHELVGSKGMYALTALFILDDIASSILPSNQEDRDTLARLLDDANALKILLSSDEKATRSLFHVTECESA